MHCGIASHKGKHRADQANKERQPLGRPATLIDKLGEDLPLGHKEEAEEMTIHLNAMEMHRESTHLKEKRETRELEAKEMENAQEPEETKPVQLPKVNPTVINSRDKGKNL